MNVINGPDLSFESQAENLTNIDTYGHGTHLAGLIAGRDPGIAPTRDEQLDKAFVGAAPGAGREPEGRRERRGHRRFPGDRRDRLGRAEPERRWIEHPGLNLSFGGRHAGLSARSTRVCGRGRLGQGDRRRRGRRQLRLRIAQLNNPAYDPYVIAVGADDTRGTDDPKDDVILVANPRQRGPTPDVVAPASRS